MKGVF
jgi:exonuclease III